MHSDRPVGSADDRGLKLDEAQLRKLSTADLIRHALAEARLLARAEVVHAKHELKTELSLAKTAGVLFGVASVLALSGVAVLFVALAAALGLSVAVGALIVGVGLLIVAGVLGMIGRSKLPKQPLFHTRQRLKDDLLLTREQLS
jgi:hypothetical protein